MASASHRALTAVVSVLGHPSSLLGVVGFGVVWRLLEPDTFDLHGVATLIAIAMTLLIQRGQNRDTAALQAKLDELIIATDGARNEVAGLDDHTGEEIEEIRQTGQVP
jgi:low affinity Fe/Cu permease